MGRKPQTKKEKEGGQQKTTLKAAAQSKVATVFGFGQGTLKLAGRGKRFWRELKQQTRGERLWKKLPATSTVKNNAPLSRTLYFVAKGG